MKRPVALVALSAVTAGCEVASGAGQSARPPTQAATVAQGVFDGSRAWEHLRQMVAIGPRPAGSVAIRQTRAYITRQLAGFGLAVEEQAFIGQTPTGPIEMVNLGASDGASSAAFLVELARVLKDLPRDYTYEFVWFDGEEAVVTWQKGVDSTYGGRHYVQASRKARSLSSIKAMILVDMIGDRNLTIRGELRSRQNHQRDSEPATSWLCPHDASALPLRRAAVGSSDSRSEEAATGVCRWPAGGSAAFVRNMPSAVRRYTWCHRQAPVAVTVTLAFRDDNRVSMRQRARKRALTML